MRERERRGSGRVAAKYTYVSCIPLTEETWQQNYGVCTWSKSEQEPEPIIWQICFQQRILFFCVSFCVCMLLFFCYFRHYCCATFVSYEIIALESRWTAFVYLLECVFVCAAASNFWQLEAFPDRTSETMAFFPFANVIIDFDNCKMHKFVNACKFFSSPICRNNANVMWILVLIELCVSIEHRIVSLEKLKNSIW